MAAAWAIQNVMTSVAAQLGDPEREKHEQARIKARANLQRIQKSADDKGRDGDRTDESGSRRDRRIEDLALNEYENLVALEVVAPEDIPVGFDGTGPARLLSPERQDTELTAL